MSKKFVILSLALLFISFSASNFVFAGSESSFTMTWSDLGETNFHILKLAHRNGVNGAENLYNYIKSQKGHQEGRLEDYESFTPIMQMTNVLGKRTLCIALYSLHFMTSDKPTYSCYLER